MKHGWKLKLDCVLKHEEGRRDFAAAQPLALPSPRTPHGAHTQATSRAADQPKQTPAPTPKRGPRRPADDQAFWALAEASRCDKIWVDDRVQNRMGGTGQRHKFQIQKAKLVRNKIFVIGNGFDLAHKLPTRFDPDFKNTVMKYEPSYFWDLYQSKSNDIWSDFENLLAYPDFNLLDDFLNEYYPDYTSDRESDRDGIISRANSIGNLRESLNEFANNAENSLANSKPNHFLERILDPDGNYAVVNEK